MKRAVVIVLTIAILGGLSVYARNQQSSASVQSASTSANTTPVATPTASNSSSSSLNATVPLQGAGYKDGTYKGDSAETPYGTVQIAVVISGGKISDVNFLQMPNDQPHSRDVTAMSEPLLKQDTLSAQSSKIDFVSGATSTSYGYQESLQAALNQAKLT